MSTEGVSGLSAFSFAFSTALDSAVDALPDRFFAMPLSPPMAESANPLLVKFPVFPSPPGERIFPPMPAAAEPVTEIVPVTAFPAEDITVPPRRAYTEASPCPDIFSARFGTLVQANIMESAITMTASADCAPMADKMVVIPRMTIHADAIGAQSMSRTKPSIQPESMLRPKSISLFPSPVDGKEIAIMRGPKMTLIDRNTSLIIMRICTAR